MNTPTESLSNRVAKGAGWTIATRFFLRGMGFLSTVILARLLTPEDFGLIALAMLLVEALSVMTEFSLNIALVVNKDYDRSHYNTVWTIKILKGIVFAIILAAFAETAASFFGDTRIENIIYFLCIYVVITGLENIGVVEYQKEMRFDYEFVLTATPRIVGFIITISCAYLWRNYWALVAGTIANKSSRLVLTYIMHPLRPRLTLVRWKELFSFSKWLVLNNIFVFLGGRSDTFFLGKYTGMSNIGVYSLAYEIATVTDMLIVMPIRRVFLSGFSKISDDIEALRNGYKMVLEVLTMVALPIAVGMGLVAEQLVPVVLGDKWMDVIPVLQVLVIFGVFQILYGVNGTIFHSQRKVQVVASMAIFRFVVLIPAVIWGVRTYGAVGAAYAVTISMGITFLISVYYITRTLKVSAYSLFIRVWRTAVSLFIMTIAVIAVPQIIGNNSEAPSLDDVTILSLKVCVGIIAYIIPHILFWLLAGRPHGPEKLALDYISIILNRIPKGISKPT